LTRLFFVLIKGRHNKLPCPPRHEKNTYRSTRGHHTPQTSTMRIAHLLHTSKSHVGSHIKYGTS
jgi:hypothetical protein